MASKRRNRLVTGKIGEVLSLWLDAVAPTSGEVVRVRKDPAWMGIATGNCKLRRGVPITEVIWAADVLVGIRTWIPTHRLQFLTVGRV